eukprot:138804_1
MWDLLASFLQRHGWTIIGLLVLWYFIKDEVMKMVNMLLHERSLKEANRPERRKVLEVDMRRVREEQQRSLQEHSKRTAQNEKDNGDGTAGQQSPICPPSQDPQNTPDTTTKPESKPRPPPTSLNRSSDYLPLMGSGGSGGYRPRRIRPRFFFFILL